MMHYHSDCNDTVMSRAWTTDDFSARNTRGRANVLQTEAPS